MTDLTKPGSYEPEGMIERPDLRCECGAHVLEKPTQGEHRFSCARYWRGKHGVCWACARTENGWQRVEVVGQLDMFEEAS